MVSEDLTLEQLGAIPALTAELARYGDSKPGPDPSTRRGPSNPSRPPLRVTVVDLLDRRLDKPMADAWGDRDADLERRIGQRRLGILGTLWAWVMMTTCEMADTNTAFRAPSDDPSVGSACTWLGVHLDWIRQYHADFDADIDWIHRDLRAALHYHDERVYHCPDCAWPIEARDDGAWWSCTGCRRTWTFAAEIARLLRQQESVMTLRRIAEHIDVPWGTLRRWKSEGRFTPVALDRGIPLYDINHVRRARARVRDSDPKHSKTA